MESVKTSQHQGDTVNGKTIQDFLDTKKGHDLANEALEDSRKWTFIARSNKGSIKLRHTPKHDQKPGEVKVFSEADKLIYLMEKKTMNTEQRKVTIKKKLNDQKHTVMEELILCFQVGEILSSRKLTILHEELTQRDVNHSSISSQMSMLVNSTAAIDWFDKTEGTSNLNPATYQMKDKYLDVPSELLKKQILASYRTSETIVTKKKMMGKKAAPIDIDLDSKEVKDALQYIIDINPCGLFQAIALLNGGKKHNSKSLAFAINTTRDDDSLTPDSYPGTALRNAIKKGGLPGILVQRSGNRHHHDFALKKEIAHLELSYLVMMMNEQIAVPSEILNPEIPSLDDFASQEKLGGQDQEVQADQPEDNQPETSQDEIIEKLISDYKTLMERYDILHQKFDIVASKRPLETATTATTPTTATGNRSFDLNINLNIGSTLMKCLEMIRGK